RGRFPAAPQLPEARDDRLRHRLYPRDDPADQGGPQPWLPRHHRRGHVRPPGRPAISAVHGPAGPGGVAPANHPQAAVTHHHPPPVPHHQRQGGGPAPRGDPPPSGPAPAGGSGPGGGPAGAASVGGTPTAAASTGVPATGAPSSVRASPWTSPLVSAGRWLR